MKLLLPFLCLVITLHANAQQSNRTFTFKEIGWTITLPQGFERLSAEEDAAKNERGQQAIEDATGTKLDVSSAKTLISATRNNYNYFNSTITPFDPKTDGDWKEVSQSVKDMVYITFAEKIPGATIDSATTTTTISGLKFDKFRVTVTVDKKVVFNSFLLSKLYKGYDFGISYVVLDEKNKNDIETMLNNSKFTK
ncbi:MAG: hypothetical protein WCF67_23620 [Chitinophagaceae bacterium]